MSHIVTDFRIVVDALLVATYCHTVKVSFAMFAIYIDSEIVACVTIHKCDAVYKHIRTFFLTHPH